MHTMHALHAVYRCASMLFPSSCLSSPYPLTHYQALVGARSIACVLVICYHFFSDFRDGKPTHACTAAANTTAIFITSTGTSITRTLKCI